MARELFTLEWALAWRDQIGANGAYQAAARTWKWPLVLVMKADPGLGLPDERSIYLDLFQGECREARVATAADLEQAPFLLSADPRTWKQVLERRLEPIPGLMRGKLKLVKGSLAVLLPYVLAAKELVESATRIDTSYPGDLAGATPD
ncbi:MAG TPA: SCP2 sterol-binding domain-containing protein [Thermoanaerobaculia bacterium]|nr:SCP2 sterol-binding domain-containing protein [Thermoanaerobaculia bacterium]